MDQGAKQSRVRISSGHGRLIPSENHQLSKEDLRGLVVFSMLAIAGGCLFFVGLLQEPSSELVPTTRAFDFRLEGHSCVDGVTRTLLQACPLLGCLALEP